MSPTPEQANQACELAAAGNTLEQIAQSMGYSVTMLYHWRRNNPLFAQALDVAREFGMDALVDRMSAVALDPAIGPQRARVWCDAIKFIAERRYRKKYGASVDLNVNQVTDLRGTMIEARKRTELPVCDLAQLPPVQDAEYVTEPDAEATDKESVGVNPLVNPFD